MATESATSSLFDSYEVLSGRRYHRYRSGDSDYPLPNDDDELYRLDLTHEMILRSMSGNLHYAPVDITKGSRILDVGTGTGIWAIEMGEKYPMAQVLGIDLTPSQPVCVPPNVKFEIDNVELDWVGHEPYHFIHLRYGAFSFRNFAKLASECYQNTTPGGWCEFQDFDLEYKSPDNTMDANSSVARWIKELIRACECTGYEPSPGPKLVGWLRDAGFQDIQTRRHEMPIGDWHVDGELKNIGRYNLQQILQGLEAFTLRLYTQTLGWDTEEVAILLAKVRKDLTNPQIHVHFFFHIAWGRKPSPV